MSNNKLKLSTISIEKLSNFIFRILETKFTNNTRDVLISYSLKIDNLIEDIDICDISKLHEKSFYLEKPDDSFTILGLGNILSVSETGQSRFSLTEKKLKTVSENFINNWEENKLSNVPLIMGGMKFMPERENELWED